MMPSVIAAMALSSLYDVEPDDPRDRGWFRLWLAWDHDGIADAHTAWWHRPTGTVLP
jgi:hypothetical protein